MDDPETRSDWAVTVSAPVTNVQGRYDRRLEAPNHQDGVAENNGAFTWM